MAKNRDAAPARKELVEVAALVLQAVNVLGRIALRKRRRLSRREAWMLEDELFVVLEKLNDMKVPGAAAVTGTEES